ncbi:MAG: DUF4832 domain-containing protein, partial [Ruminococcaceae bacterium]|nr:DUF4832 domain-containing protein [Oscillospiraceae bacterium]
MSDCGTMKVQHLKGMADMLQKATITNTFSFRPEEGISPYMGFMSFQHFRGEKLYSDCVVLPERNYTETEHYECYPIPDYVEQNGREEGYYPDSSVVYIRALWKEFEPERGVYNFDLLDQIIADALAHRQTLIFRLMAHSTRACDDVPEWLKTLIPCPERPDGMRVKDSPTDPLFIELFCELVKKIAERYDGNPVFDCIDISLPGSWGEGHNLHLYSPEDLQKMVDAYVKNFKHTQLIGQCSRPELLQYASSFAPVGWRGDGLGEPHHTFEMYPERIAKIPELWKQGPVSFESYWWLGEWQRKGWDVDRIIAQTLEWHLSSFNAKSLPVPNEWKDKVDAWVAKMGYHFVIDYAKLPEKAAAGDTMELGLGIDNRGVAPLYRKLPLQVRLCNENGSYIL